MTSTLTKAKVLRVKVEEGKTGLFYATSPDLKGLLVAEPTIDALEEAIPGAITDLFAACGVMVVVTKAGDNVARHTLERLNSFVDGVAGKRLTYKALIA